MDDQTKIKFKKMLEYQKKDIELRKIIRAIENDESAREMAKYKRAFNDAKRAIDECEATAAELLDSFAELQKYIADNESLLAELEAGSAEDEEQLAQRVKRLESLKSKFANAERRMHDMEETIRTLSARRTEAVNTGRAAKEKYKEAQKKYNGLVAAKQDEIKRLKTELEQMRATLDSDLLAEYMSLVEDKKFPPIVPATPDEKKNMFNCGGCGLNLSQKGNSMLNSQGYFRCENCRRIIVLL